MPNQKPNIIVILGGLLLLVVVGAAAVWWFLPSAEPLTPPSAERPSPPAAQGGAVFDLKLFDRSQYQGLSHQLIETGSLPVQAPAGTGKANPFL
ncbi:MAG: hypothetical protein AAB538_02365 [Patescibacteria group bacterium]